MEAKTKLTAEEFFRLYPEESRVELVEGKVYEMPAPSLIHQEILMRIASAMKSFVKERTYGNVFVAPVDVVFSENTVLQPDVVWAREFSFSSPRIDRVPELVVEIVSPSTIIRDLTDKMKIYEKSGVQEYWLVLPLEKVIIVYTLTSEGYRLYSSATDRGKVQSKVLEGFELAVEEVFEGF
ncbi:MAG: Uma2 family endonuclease [Aquificaceae bacterium]|jgi:Uma2 family endonuclease|uniref:Uma2 family endonuclease n=1 Tax=Hydrogenobacter sp. Uz 6-8 TaxID=3384828 RepID=UPI000F1F4AAE|nr:MAG: Uma2 family endonuclease [Aquificota bacterium]